jgi:cell division protein FtsB
MALGAVLCVVGALYVQHAVAWFSSRSNYEQAHSQVLQLQRSNAALERQEKALRNPATILLDARRLGMVRPGERPYVLNGVPSQ